MPHNSRWPLLELYSRKGDGSTNRGASASWVRGRLFGGVSEDDEVGDDRADEGRGGRAQSGGGGDPLRRKGDSGRMGLMGLSFSSCTIRLKVVIFSACTRETCFIKDIAVFSEKASVTGAWRSGDELLLEGDLKGEVARSKGDAVCREDGVRGVDDGRGEEVGRGEAKGRSDEARGDEGCQCQTVCSGHQAST